MKVLLYTVRENGVAVAIEKWAQSVISPEHFGICRSLKELENTLRQLSFRCRLAILNINGAEEMDGLIRMKNLLDDIRIILIVPDVTKDLARKGYQLYPRFMTDSHIDTNQLASVIQKNLDYLNSEHVAVGGVNCRMEPFPEKRK
jgi:hypothetical protein